MFQRAISEPMQRPASKCAIPKKNKSKLGGEWGSGHTFLKKTLELLGFSLYPWKF